MKEARASDLINAEIEKGLRKKQNDQPERNYIGASVIGGDCDRALQFAFAKAKKEREFSLNTLCKFDLGHSTEELSRWHFWDAGFDLVQKDPGTGEMIAFRQLNGMFKGHPDGVFLGGPKIEGVGYPCLWEHKGVGGKTFREIERDGLKKARPVYWAQVQIEMAYLYLDKHPTIFTVWNLDSAERLHLLIDYDQSAAQDLSDRAVRLIEATKHGELLPRGFANPDHFMCKTKCDFRERCWRF